MAFVFFIYYFWTIIHLTLYAFFESSSFTARLEIELTCLSSHHCIYHFSLIKKTVPNITRRNLDSFSLALYLCRITQSISCSHFYYTGKEIKTLKYFFFCFFRTINNSKKGSGSLDLRFEKWKIKRKSRDCLKIQWDYCQWILCIRVYRDYEKFSYSF